MKEIAQVHSDVQAAVGHDAKTTDQESKHHKKERRRKPNKVHNIISYMQATLWYTMIPFACFESRNSWGKKHLETKYCNLKELKAGHAYMLAHWSMYSCYWMCIKAVKMILGNLRWEIFPTVIETLGMGQKLPPTPSQHSLTASQTHLHLGPSSRSQTPHRQLHTTLQSPMVTTLPSVIHPRQLLHTCT